MHFSGSYGNRAGDVRCVYEPGAPAALCLSLDAGLEGAQRKGLESGLGKDKEDDSSEQIAASSASTVWLCMCRRPSSRPCCI